MAKINLNGEYLEFDFSHKPMSEALALEKAMGKRYADWESDLAAGSMEAMGGLVWLIWRRNGRNVPLEAILAGEVEVDLVPLLESLQALTEEAQEEEAGPTAPSGTAPARTATTPGNTSPRSRKSSASGRGRSAS